jgi:hypothetical protein
MAKPEDTIGASCPEGGDFYVCEESGFIGCCTSNACQSKDARCDDQKLEPMGFDAAEYTKIPAQDCFGSESGVEWYVCTGTDNFAFMGCCAVNACSSGGCPDDELRLSKMSSNEKNAQIFLGGEPETTTASTETSSATESATTSIESFASTTGSSPSETTSSDSGGGSSSSGGLSQGATIGIAVGASLAGVAIIAALLFLFWRRMKRSRQQQADASKGPLMGFTGAGGHESSQFQDMKYQSQYSPNTASFVGMQSPQSPNFTHPNSPQPYHDRSSYHPGMTTSNGLHHLSNNTVSSLREEHTTTNPLPRT